MKATELPRELMAMRHYSIPLPTKSLQHGDTLCYLRIIRDADILAYGEVRVVGAGESRAQGRATVWHDAATSPPSFPAADVLVCQIYEPTICI
jgi:hypothetical protein